MNEHFEIVSNVVGCCNSFGTYLARIVRYIEKEGELKTKYNIAYMIFYDQQKHIEQLKCENEKLRSMIELGIGFEDLQREL